MKHFLIRYQLKNGSPQEWHQEIARFIAALEEDAALAGRISYRCMKIRDEGASYVHLAAAADDDAIKILGERPFFAHYTEQSEIVSGGSVEVLPLEIIAETKNAGGR